ncbi:MAG: methylenetetrahydrofolate reductase [NAD(P)H] [Eubacteriales bacterium]|nr:methylenetetrahydrofolate reductase [NAD(P)H] [Eubacteriales bacterium]
MLISRLLQNKPLTVSCELFPPKPGQSIEPACKVVEETAALRPDFISVTYGAAGSTSKNTIAICEAVQAQEVPALAHLTCCSADKNDISAYLDRLVKSGIHNVLALRGDIPEGMEFPTPRQFTHAVELVSTIREYGGFCIGAACYPEGHVEAPSQEEDICRLKEKVDAGCDFLTTQMFFDNNMLYRFLYRALAAGINVPVIAGIMPITSRVMVERSIKLSGATLPPRFLRLLDRFGGDKAAMEQAGIAYATDQIIDLIANGVRGVHIYTMNRPEIAKKIIQNLSCIVKARNVNAVG